MSTLYKLRLKKRQVTRQVSAKTNKYQHNFIASTIRDWNSLPNRVIEEQSVEAFKTPPGAMFKKTLTPLLFFIQHTHPVSFF